MNWTPFCHVPITNNKQSNHKEGNFGGGGGYPIPQYREGSSLPNTVVQKDEKPHTAGLNDTAIPHIKIQITEKTLEK